MTPTTRYVPLGIDVGGIVFNLPRIFMIFSATLATFTLIYRPQLRISYSDIGVVSLLLLLVFSVAWSVAPEESVRRASDLLFYIAYLFSIIVYFNRRKSFDVLVSVLVIPAVAMISYSILNLIYPAPGWRLAGLISRNGVSRDMVAVLPILIFSTYGRNKTQLGARLLLAGLMILFVLLSGSRSGLMALVVVLVLTTLVWSIRIKELSFKYLVVTSVASLILMTASIAIVYAAGVLPRRILRIPLINGGISPETLGTARYQVRLAELETIQKYPVTGIGYGAFFQYSADQFGIGNYRAHSLITRVWMGAGVPGLLLLVLTGIAVLRNYLQRIVTDRSDESLRIAGCLIGLIATMLTGMFNIVITQPLFYVLLGVGSSAALTDE